MQSPTTTTVQLSNVITAADKRSHSVIWNSFERITWQPGRKGTKTAKCQRCDHPTFRLTNGTTNSMWRHLEIAHPDAYRETDSKQKKKRARTEVSESCDRGYDRRMDFVRVCVMIGLILRLHSEYRIGLRSITKGFNTRWRNGSSTINGRSRSSKTSSWWKLFNCAIRTRIPGNVTR